MEAVILIAIFGGCAFVIARFVRSKLCATSEGCGCSCPRAEDCGVAKKTTAPPA